MGNRSLTDTDLIPHDKDYTLRVMIGEPTELRFCLGDLTEDPADAIVNAANSDLLPGGGLCGAINFKGGAEIFRECARIRRMNGPVMPGRAVATTAGDLPSKYVIHAVGPVWEDGMHGEAKKLARCYQESMRIADELQLHSLSVPALSTGIFRYPVEQAAQVAIPTVISALAGAKHLVLVSFVLYDRKTRDVFARVALSQLQPGTNEPYKVAIAI